MRVPSRPRQHRARDPEVIVLSGRTAIDRSALPILYLEIGQLLKGATHHRYVGKSDKSGLQFGVEQFEQIGSAHGIDRKMAMFHRPPLGVHAIAMAADLKA